MIAIVVALREALKNGILDIFKREEGPPSPKFLGKNSEEID